MSPEARAVDTAPFPETAVTAAPPTSPARAPAGVSPLVVARRVAAKEMALFLASPIAWLFLASFAAVSLFAVFWGEAFFARNIADVRPLFEWMPLLLIFLASALTMRLWSEERRTGTLEHVLAQPAPIWSFVLGKFLACLALLAIALLVTVPLPATVATMGELDPGPVLAGYLATFLLGAAYLAIGLFVSARTDNQIVALIGAIALSGLLWLIGSPLVTALVDQRAAELLGALSTGARFDSIVRGVIDLGDLVYCASLALAFLAANAFALERERWARHAGPERTPRHRRWRTVTALVMANAIALNLWVGRLDGARIDVTEGGRYTLSDATRSLLAGLSEPLLLRAYFSERTHPLLAPLVPEVRDLLREYEVAGDGRVRVEIVDPQADPEIEAEASRRYGIEPVPFQVSGRYESSIVSGYFDVLVQYGDAHETLGFQDLIDVRQRGETDLDVRLRNPEFDLSRAIRRTVSDFRGGGGVGASLSRPVTLRAWISGADRLPAELADFAGAALERAEAVATASGGKLAVERVDPDAPDDARAEAARALAAEIGLRPLAGSLFGDDRFWFHVLLDDGEELVQVPLDELSAERFEANLEAGLGRFAAGLTRTVALAVPAPAAPMALGRGAGPTFSLLAESLRAEHRVVDEDLADGRVSAEADLLIVAAPESLDERGRFAIDQFLMRGGTVILATSPWSATFARDRLELAARDSGLGDWLGHHGIEIGGTLVMDPRNVPFPVPVARDVGGMQLRELRLLDYPYFVDVGRDAMADSPLVGDLDRLTVPWASPIELAPPAEGLADEVLLESSAGAWLSASPDVSPRLAPDGAVAWTPEGETGARVLGVARHGTFDSYFADRPSPLAAADEESDGSADGPGDGATDGADGGTDDAAAPGAPDLADALGAVVERSPESARLVVLASNDLLSDAVTDTLSAVGGSGYLAPYQLVAGAVDAALDGGALSGIRARGAFNRTLDPMSDAAKRNWELLNYALAALAILAVYAVARAVRRARERRQLAWLDGDGGTTGGGDAADGAGRAGEART